MSFADPLLGQQNVCVVKRQLCRSGGLMNTPSEKPDRIDLNDKAACESWVRKLNVTHEKLREVVGAVGDDPKQVEKHLKENAEKHKDGRGNV
jgi:hypothetical protein